MDSIQSLQQDIQHHLKALIQQYAARDDLLTLQQFLRPAEHDPTLQDISNDVMQLLIAWHRSGGDLQLTTAAQPHEVTSLALHQDASSETDSEAAEDDEPTTEDEPAEDESAEDEPPAVDEPPAAEPSPPATNADIARLMSGFGKPFISSPADQMLIAGEHLLTAFEAREGLSGGALCEFLSQQCAQLSVFEAAPSELLKLWLAWLAAELRTLQETSPGLNLDASFNQVTAFSKSRQPGFIHGLARHHQPRHGSWMNDAASYHAKLVKHYVKRAVPPGQSQADQALNALRSACDAGEPGAICARVRETLRAGVSSNDVRLLQQVTPYLEHLEGSDLESLRAAVRAYSRPPAEPQATEKTSVSAAVRAWTSGRRARLLGGVPRTERLSDLKEKLGFQDIHWEELSNACIERTINQLHSGQVDVVIAIQNLISHTVEYRVKPTCKDASVPYVLVGGYGVTAIGHALARLATPTA